MDYHQLVIKVYTSLLTTHSFDSGEAGKEMQDRGPEGLALETLVLDVELFH